MPSNASKETEIEDVFYFTYHIFAGEIQFALALGTLPMVAPATTTLLHKGFSQEKLMETVCSGIQTHRN